MSWLAIVALAAGTYACKAAGPLLLGDRPLPQTMARLVALLPAALLAALVAVQTVVDDRALVLDARLAGVAVGAVAVWRKAPFLVIVVAACAATAAVRAVA